MLTETHKQRISSSIGGRKILGIVLMMLGVSAVYFTPASNSVLVGSDYLQLHSRRMEFARDALFGVSPNLPAWYPRELLGTPFWSNIQNFPFIPSRLLVLLSMEPNGPYTYLTAVLLSAQLAALFMYLYLRLVGLGVTGSAVAGWTFACSGYYASRVVPGHLPLLEAYPALPLLLWTVERVIQAQERNQPIRLKLWVASICTACVMLAGHPQLPLYTVTVAALYSLFRGGLRFGVWICSALALGAGISSFALLPMVMLIGRSTRILALDAPLNDISMPYQRLVSFFFPWGDGIPPPLVGFEKTPFHGYLNNAYFWDTVGYIGLLPWIGIAILSFFARGIKVEPVKRRIAWFVLITGVSGIVISLPFFQQIRDLLPGTLLRSPARAIYLTEFALAASLGGFFHWLNLATISRIGRAVVPLFLLIHVFDLGAHSRRFILRASLDVPTHEMEIFKNFLKKDMDGRVAMDYFMPLPLNRQINDIGFFDSIMLAHSYRMVVNLAELPRKLNVQTLNGSELPERALAALGVKYVVTPSERGDLQKEAQIRSSQIYSVRNPASIAKFYNDDEIKYLPQNEIVERLRDKAFDLNSALLLPMDVRQEARVTTDGSSAVARVECQRLDSDSINCTAITDQSGYLRLIESWDSGWSATMNGLPVSIEPAYGALLSVRLPPGRNEIRFVFRTPGVWVGIALSGICIGALYVLITGAAVRSGSET